MRDVLPQSAAPFRKLLRLKHFASRACRPSHQGKWPVWIAAIRAATDRCGERSSIVGGNGSDECRKPGCPDATIFARLPAGRSLSLPATSNGGRLPHGLILAAVLGAVASSIGAQYGVKMLVDTLAGRA